MLGALHLGIFEQPAKIEFFRKLLDKKKIRRFDQFLQPAQEFCGHHPIDDPVVDGEGEVHERSHLDPSFHDDRALFD